MTLAASLVALALLAPAELPTIAAPVTDLAGVVADEQEMLLTTHVENLRATTGVQLAILIVPALPAGQTIEDFSMAVATAWRGGSASRDDGLLLTLAMADRKSRLEVGYGLEALLTDGEAGEILHAMRAKLRAEDVSGALIDATLAIHDEVAMLTPESSRALWKSLGVLTLLYRLVRLPLIGFVVGALACIAVLSLRRRKGPRPKWVPGLVHHRVLSILTFGATTAGLLFVDLTLVGLPATFGAWSTAVAAVLFGAAAASAKDKSTLKWACIAAAVMLGLSILPVVLLDIEGLGSVLQLVSLALFLPFTFGFAGRIEGGDGGGSSSSYSSSSSSSSDWSSSSSSSSSSDSSGGGGSFGGGGASSDW